MNYLMVSRRSFIYKIDDSRDFQFENWPFLSFHFFSSRFIFLYVLKFLAREKTGNLLKVCQFLLIRKRPLSHDTSQWINRNFHHLRSFSLHANFQFIVTDKCKTQFSAKVLFAFWYSNIEKILNLHFQHEISFFYHNKRYRDSHCRVSPLALRRAFFALKLLISFLHK